MPVKRATVAAAVVVLTGLGASQIPVGRRLACTVLQHDGGYVERVFAKGVPRGAVPHFGACRDLGVATLLTPAQEDGRGSCACWAPDAGPCDDTLGRTRGFNEAEPGTWHGSGCVPKPCGQYAGMPNWPAGCQQ